MSIRPQLVQVIGFSLAEGFQKTAEKTISKQ